MRYKYEPNADSRIDLNHDVIDTAAPGGRLKGERVLCRCSSPDARLLVDALNLHQKALCAAE